MLEASSQPDVHYFVSLALGLAPVVGGATIKWLQDSSKTKRRSQLSEQLVNVSKTYCDQSSGADDVLTASRAVLANEIRTICAELTLIQADSKRSSHRNLHGWLTEMLLLFKPLSFLAWIVHLVYYFGLIVVLFGFAGVASTPFDNDTKSALGGLFIFGLILLGLQRLAMWLHKRRLQAIEAPSASMKISAHSA